MDCPPRGHFRRGDRFLGKAHTPGPLRPAFPAFLAGAGRPLLPPMIDYSVFSQLAAARGSIISGPVNRSATAFNFSIWAKFGLRVIWLLAIRFAAGGRRAAGSRRMVRGPRSNERRRPGGRARFCKLAARRDAVGHARQKA